MFAFGAMLLASLGNLKSQGPALAVAVIVMAVAALTLVPAVMSLVGPRIYWPSKTVTRTPRGAVFARLGRTTAARPGWVALASGGLLALLALGSLTFKADYNILDQLPSDTPSAKAFKTLQTGFPAGALAPSQVYLQSTDGSALQPAAAAAFAQAMATAPGVGTILPNAEKSLYTLGADGKTAQVDAVLKDDPYANASLDVIDDLRAYAHQAAAASAQPGLKSYVGGTTATSADTRTATSRDEKVVFPVAAALIALVLILLLRSLVAPWYLLLAVGLLYLATLGATALFFQSVLGKAGLMSALPIMVYMFVVAIGSDYNILMVARLREEARQGNTPRRAADLAVEHAGPSVASAGLILAGTFASLLLAGVALLMQLGFAVAIGIALAAFVMALFLVPALTALVGHAAWWPGHQDERAG
ncbi:MMPL family transporter [Catenulispora yoronensis]